MADNKKDGVGTRRRGKEQWAGGAGREGNGSREGEKNRGGATMTARETANQRSRIKFPLTPAQPPPVIVSFYAPSLPCPLTPSSSTSFISVQFPFSRASFPLRSSPLLPVPFHGNLLEEICYSNIARSARRQEPRTSGGVTGRDGKRAEKEGEEIVDGALGSFRGEDLLTNRVVKTTSRKCSRLASNRERERVHGPRFAVSRG